MLVLARNWWILVLRGVLALLFGVIAFFLPNITLEALVLLFGAFAIVDGAFAIGSVISGGAGRQDRWWAVLLEGILGITAGVIAFVWPAITAITLLYVIAAWSIVTGLMEIVAAVRLRREIEGEWLLALAGLASILFGIVVVIFPGAGALAVVWVIGTYAVFFGILLIALGLRLRGLHRTIASQPA
jgi:uncharacterized membrane protein HdeD (DUF308 family)